MTAPKKIKYVYQFGNKNADGNGSMKNLLGGKGANLAEMCLLGIPVPAGFTVSTECCTAYYESGCKLPAELTDQVISALRKTETVMGKKYGDPANPLLVSCRSGARSSMPGMMDTVLNVGLSPATIPGMIKKTNNPRFVWDSYRRLVMMYADVVMEKAEGLEPAGGKGIRKIMDERLDAFKHAKSYASDTDLKAEDLQQLAEEFKALIKKYLGKDFPDDPMAQLWGGIAAVFKSWNGKKAVSYRRIEGIPDDWGTAVNVQSMVFGNMGDSSATGVAFTRDPATGENKFYGEWLVNAQGEDVVAGIRTPSPINDDTKNEQNKHLKSMAAAMPSTYKELVAIRKTLETNFKDMLDIEFTIEEGKLWMLQCRVGKRTGAAALNMAMDMLSEKLIDQKTAVRRLDPKQLDELLHPIIDPKAEKDAKPIVKGLPAGPGAACGVLVFTAEEAVAVAKKGKKCILLREETNPEDVEGMRAAQAILTARGGMTSHAALVARACQRPVLLQWSREEELAWSPFGSAMRLSAATEFAEISRTWHKVPLSSRETGQTPRSGCAPARPGRRRGRLAWLRCLCIAPWTTRCTGRPYPRGCSWCWEPLRPRRRSNARGEAGLGEGGEQVPEAIAPVEQLVVVATHGRRLRQALEGLVELGADALGGVWAVLGNVEEDLAKAGGRLGSEYEAALHGRGAFFPAWRRSPDTFG